VRQKIYSEWVPTGLLIKILFSIVIIVLLISSTIMIITGIAFTEPIGIIIIISMIMLFMLLFWNYRGIKIQINNKELSVRYGFFNQKSIQIGNIISCEIIKASFRRYGGIGVRYGGDGSQAYTTSFGEAVKIIPYKGRPFVFSSHTPQKICKIINQIKK
jgi:hypothetical protein